MSGRNETICVKVTPEFKAAFYAEAARRGVTASNLVFEQLRKSLSAQAPDFDALCAEFPAPKPIE